jgi:CDAN1-interacting nuclease 1
MLQAEYDEVVRSMLTRQDVGTCAAASEGQPACETLLAVYEQASVGQMARSSYLAKEHGKQFVERFERGQSLLDVAEWIKLSPCMVARCFLELKLNAGRQGVSSMLRKPELIQDERIRKAVGDCLRSDEHAGPYLDRGRAVVGVEYEFILMGKLRNLGLEFETESDLRARGADRTPDVLLSVPVAFNGRVVRRIDSKAKSGDDFPPKRLHKLNKLLRRTLRARNGRILVWFYWKQ